MYQISSFLDQLIWLLAATIKFLSILELMTFDYCSVCTYVLVCFVLVYIVQVCIVSTRYYQVLFSPTKPWKSMKELEVH